MIEEYKKLNRIRELRKMKGVTQKEVAKAIGISQGMLTNYETGKRSPRDKETWEKLANYFNVSVPYIMGLTDGDKVIAVLDSVSGMLIDTIVKSNYKRYIAAFTKLNDLGQKELFNYSESLASQEKYQLKEIDISIDGVKIENALEDYDIEIIKRKKDDK